MSSAATRPRDVSLPWLDKSRELLPGLLLCAAVVLVAELLQAAEVALFGRAWLESLVLAILIGTVVRSVWTPPKRFNAGIAFSAKMLLEIAVMLLGASLSLRAMLAAGPVLLLGIAAVVAVSLAFSFGIGRMLGLPTKMAVLVACGNSICGNSAIAAAAPVIGADAKDVASSIAFTAVLGVLVVLLLPLLMPLLGLNELQYGVLAGLTVYAVPQVLAATAPVAALSVQIGTLVKLVRVLMLGPVVLGLSLVAGRTGGKKPPLSRLVPWFILGFLALAGLRAAGLLPEAALGPISTMAGVLTVLSMAALGLGVDVRVVARAGARVTATVVLSLLALGAAALGLIHLLPPV
ncbi:putative sulfate exporter family transporter [Pseudoroseomonas wenyumeiae]|uniref:Sulfate exporter family transporter n=1 Tax=Teichococcus wenyumeiae TaxID=2478470 RepID=A0A3A9JI80_9PROT|nr:putative sulfate exporter family transporter [Pseudoroseomonas wenyumeiae]RKK04473.1 putative sulfate exporter family transporter [Pseudoroseomonas wenyumeiae]RMI25707.1 putative sulfate exporter family transporter [Pseudoroseomonas wenyumeiae]